MTRAKCVILCLSLIFAAQGFAADLVATIKAYNKAELSGEVPIGTEVTYYNSAESKGQITAQAVATLRITNMPQCTVTKITFYLKSNAKSGSGALAVSLRGSIIAEISNSQFAEWPGTGGYQTSYVPVSFSGSWQANAGDNIVCQIAGSVNTIYWEKVVVTYFVAEPDPRTVTFSWFDENGITQHTTITEQSSGSGIILPQCPVSTVVSKEEWTFAGWTITPFFATYTSALPFFKQGEKFYPSEDQALYALYYVEPELTPIVQTTDFVSGEYAIAMHADTFYRAYGDVLFDSQNKSRGYIAAKKCEVLTNEKGQRQFASSYIPVEQRYQITFIGDSLQIRNLATGNSIGHKNNYLSNNDVKWAWKEAKNHSLAIFYDTKETDKGSEARFLWLSLQENDCFDVQLLQVNFDYEMILLFDVSKTPTSQPQTRWTSCPFECEQAVEQIAAPSTQARKILQNGILYIEINDTKYNLLGNKIN